MRKFLLFLAVLLILSPIIVSAQCCDSQPPDVAVSTGIMLSEAAANIDSIEQLDEAEEYLDAVLATLDFWRNNLLGFNPGGPQLNPNNAPLKVLSGEEEYGPETPKLREITDKYLEGLEALAEAQAAINQRRRELQG